MKTTYSDCPHCGERTKWWKHMRKGYLCMQCGYPDPSGPDCPRCMGTTKPQEIGVEHYYCTTCGLDVDGDGQVML